MHTPHTSTPTIYILYHPHPVLSPLTPQMAHCLHFLIYYLFVLFLLLSYLFCYILCYFYYYLLFFFYFILSLCVLFIINLFCTPVLQTLTQHSSDGCNPLLLSTALEAMSTGASVLTYLSLTQNKPSFILCLNFDFTFWATKYSWALKSASKV